VTIYGQEMDNATTALAKMNMILHGHPTAEVWNGNTLSSPHYTQEDGRLKLFDFAVANPPFSSKAWRSGFDPEHDLYGRFADGVPPDKNGDYAFLMHLLRSLKSTGKGAIILPHGVLFRGNAEGDIRKNIISRGVIKGIIGLPANLFYGTGIPACIIVIDKENAPTRTGIFMIDASKGFMKDGPKNRLRHQDIHRIVDVFNKQIEVPKYSRMVSHAEIAANDYNLNIPRYIDSTEPEDLQDIAAHLLGGIPERDIVDLDRFWQVFPTLRTQLFEAGTRVGYSELKVAASEIKPTIFAHPEFVAYREEVKQLFTAWQAHNIPRLKRFAVGNSPRVLIETLAEDLLATFAEVRLIDRYDVYQHLMDYWTETMQDDAYMITVDGWQANTDLVPPVLVIARYFAAEQKAVDDLTVELESINQQIDELVEEHGGEDGLLEEAKNEKGKIAKASAKARLKAIKDDAAAGDERKVLQDYTALTEQAEDLRRQVRLSQAVLDDMVSAKYKTMNENEVKTLVVGDKWLAALDASLQTELDRVSQALTGRIKQLAERYATPQPTLLDEVSTLSHRVDAHLARMGFTWR
jgi:type I restriction enzyme M protein